MQTADPASVTTTSIEKDSNTNIEVWGPDAFSRRLRTKIHTTKVQRAPGVTKPVGWNILLLGPAGNGKSSLIYTWWRALTGRVDERHDPTQLEGALQLRVLPEHRDKRGWVREAGCLNHDAVKAPTAAHQPL